MPKTSSAVKLPPLSEIIANNQLSAQKTLGQHFLLDLNLTDRIARSAGNLADATVIEVGPGPGGLTRSLLKTETNSVIVIERDPRCINALAPLKEIYPNRLMIIEGDALKLDLSAIGSKPRHVVANLPYNVGTALLIRWLGQIECFSSLTLMFRREVADRIVANPGTKSYGRLSVLCNWLCNTNLLFGIPARAFTPPPKVDSALVKLTPYQTLPCEADQEALEEITRAAFGQRRKMMRSALRQLDVDANTLLTEAAILPTRRAEELTIEEFGALAKGLNRLRRAS